MFIRWFATPFLSISAAFAEPVKIITDEPVPMPHLIHTVNVLLLMETAFQGIGYNTPIIEQGMRDLSLTGLRFPGGTVANNYLWQEDGFSEPNNDLTGWAGEQIRVFNKLEKKYGLEDYIRLCKRVSATPIWVLNIYEETPESTIALIKHLRSQGLGPDIIEMGNEPYWDGRSRGNVHQYLQFCRPLAAAIKKEFPEIRIGGCLGPIHDGGAFQAKWNEAVAKEPWCEAIVYHEYFGGQGFALEKGEKVPMEAMLRPEAMVAEPVKVIAGLAPGKPIWFTEWNMGQEALKQWKNTGAELHFIAAVFQSLLDHSDTIEIACFHQLYDGMFGTFYVDKETGETVHKPTYHLLKMIGAATSGAETMTALDFEGTDDSIYGFNTKGPEGVRSFLVNRSDKPVELTLPGTADATRALFLIESPPERQFSLNEEIIKRSDFSGPELVLPPYSIALVAADSTMATPDPEVANLFARRPDLQLWYPPYASQQPSFDDKGIYTVDTSTFKDKETAILKMNLESLHLDQGMEYTVSLDISSEPAADIVISYPGEKDFLLTTPTSQRQNLTFKIDSTTPNFDFVFLKPNISAGVKYSFQNFSIVQEPK